MKKIHAVILVLMAVSAFSVFVAESASAETTLGAEWLANGKAVTTNLASETTGEFLLEDSGLSVAVLCSAILEGRVGATGTDEITKILNLMREEVSKFPLAALALNCATEDTCSSKAPIEVWPVGLPWKTSLYTMENGEILDLFEGSGWEVTCFVLNEPVEDTCTAVDTNLPVINDPTTGDAEIPGGDIAEPLLKCTESGDKETGVFETDELMTITLVNGELLTVDAL